MRLHKKPPTLLPGNSGAILLLTVFILFALGTMALSYWSLVETRVQRIENRRYEQAAFYAAHAGIEDALYEIKLGRDWDIDQIDSQWKEVNPPGNGQFFKSTVATQDPLTHFNFPTTFNVEVLGDPSVGTINIVSTASVTPTGTEPIYIKVLNASAVRSSSGEVYVLSISEK